jgi:hypothetical protein
LLPIPSPRGLFSVIAAAANWRGFGFVDRTHTARHHSEGLLQDQGQHSLGVQFIVLDLPCGQDLIIPPPKEGILL